MNNGTELQYDKQYPYAFVKRSNVVQQVLSWTTNVFKVWEFSLPPYLCKKLEIKAVVWLVKQYWEGTYQNLNARSVQRQHCLYKISYVRLSWARQQQCFMSLWFAMIQAYLESRRYLTMTHRSNNWGHQTRSQCFLVLKCSIQWTRCKDALQNISSTDLNLKGFMWNVYNLWNITKGMPLVL